MTRTPNHTAPDRDVLDDAAELFKLLSTAGRLHLLWILSDDELDVTTLVAAVGGTKAAISQHLAKLRRAGWIDGRRDGRHVLYRVVDPHIVALVHQAVENILDLRAARGPAPAPSGQRRSATTGQEQSRLRLPASRVRPTR